MEELFEYLKELSANNNREWYHANKEQYKRVNEYFTDIVQQLIERVSLLHPEFSGLQAKECLFRIHRDIRFSPDKTPYKTHFGAYLALGGRKSEFGGYYIHLSPSESLLGGGIWCPPPPLLKKLRQDIYDNMDEFIGIIENPTFKTLYPKIEGEKLKRMPVGYPEDTPHGEVLKYKHFTVSTPKTDQFFLSSNWMDQLVDNIKVMMPFNQFLNYTVEEFIRPHQ